MTTKTKCLNVCEIIWISFLFAVLLLSAVRVGVNPFTQYSIEIPEWFFAEEAQHILNIVTFVLLLFLTIFRAIINIIAGKKMEAVCESDREEKSKRIEQLDRRMERCEDRLNALSDKQKSIEYATHVRCINTLHSVKERETAARLAWRKHFKGYCRAVPQLYAVAKKAGKCFKQALDQLERKN